MKISETIPMTPQPWNKNPYGYVYHQQKLKELVQWFEDHDVPVRLPEDTGSWDHGVDLIVRDSRIDLKSFGLDFYGRSLTWASSYYRGRRAPLYRGTQTDYFIHPTEGDPSTWIVAPVSELRTSKFGYAPYYFQSATCQLKKWHKGGLQGMGDRVH